MSTAFRDRQHAGQVLATRLRDYAHHPDALAFGLPRGGVPVAYEVALALELPLDVCVVRKLGVPGREELAMGAIATGGMRVLNDAVISSLGISSGALEDVTAAQRAELLRREHAYRGDQPPPIVRDRTILLIDDGMATGATMFAAIAALRQRQPARIVVAVPVAAPATCQQAGTFADEVVCAIMPDPFYAVGLWYDDFEQTDDATIHTLLAQCAQALQASRSAPPAPPTAPTPPDTTDDCAPPDTSPRPHDSASPDAGPPPDAPPPSGDVSI